MPATIVTIAARFCQTAARFCQLRTVVKLFFEVGLLKFLPGSSPCIGEWRASGDKLSDTANLG